MSDVIRRMAQKANYAKKTVDKWPEDKKKHSEHADDRYINDMLVRKKSFHTSSFD